MPSTDAGSQALRQATVAVLDELAAAPAERRYDELTALGSEVRHLLGDLVRASRTGDARALEDRCGETLELAREIWEQAGSDPAALAALDLEQELAELVTLVARLKVASRLDRIAVRDTATAAGLAPSYLSELRSVKKGLPSADAAARLDQVLGVPDGEQALLDLVSSTKSSVDEITGQGRRRREVVTSASGVEIPHDLRARDRLRDVAESLRTDEALLRAVEQLIGLRGRERRAVLRAIAELSRPD